MDKSETDDVKESLERLQTALLKLHSQLLLVAVRKHFSNMIENEGLARSAMENCKSETVRQWLKENLGSAAFCQLADTFSFLKRHIDEAESRLRGGHIDIVFIAHGSIRGGMVAACCLLPLASITEVLLYAPWNCVMSAEAANAVATGRMKPQDRGFYSRRSGGHSVPSDQHRPKNLPDRWNSMKQAGDQLIPNIMLSPLGASEAPTWERLSGPERNRLIIPYVGPWSAGSVPFSVVTLALSLVLLSSRFRATVHLVSCLGDQSTGNKFDREYLGRQYACTDDDTVMTFSPHTTTTPFYESIKEKLQRLLGLTPP